MKIAANSIEFNFVYMVKSIAIVCQIEIGMYCSNWSNFQYKWIWIFLNIERLFNEHVFIPPPIISNGISKSSWIQTTDNSKSVAILSNRWHHQYTHSKKRHSIVSSQSNTEELHVNFLLKMNVRFFVISFLNLSTKLIDFNSKLSPLFSKDKSPPTILTK